MYESAHAGVHILSKPLIIVIVNVRSSVNTHGKNRIGYDFADLYEIFARLTLDEQLRALVGQVWVTATVIPGTVS